MSNFPIIFGIIGKKLYLTILLALTLILYYILKGLIPKGHDIPLINNLGGSAVEMLSVLIPYIFKFKGKSETSRLKCSKVIFKDYFILLLICLFFFGAKILFEYVNIKGIPLINIWIRFCFEMMFFFILSIIILKTKYYIHSIISMILYCIFPIINDLIEKNFKLIKLDSFLYLIIVFMESLICCYFKYLIDKKYHSYWNILFFFGLYFFIFYSITFIIIIIKDPYNNSTFQNIRNAETKYIILNFFLDSILNTYLKHLFALLILEYFSLNHVLLSHILFKIVDNFIICVKNFKSLKNNLFFLIPVFFQILS